ncbi:MAG: SulP family inorganic anion transporter [Lachnospiraceae bacterium]|nr:SulP family inorganic anion transporter [Lachnospiraceae bacterium]
MESIKPKLFSVMKDYSKEQFIKDVIAGIIVAIIALPLSIALAIASGVNPERGLYTAIIAGFFISFLGGSRVQIGGPTAAFVVIIYGIIQTYGMDGLIVATIMAGIILIIMGIAHFGSLIKFIPYTITTGFTAGIAITLMVGQLKDFFGLDMGAVPSEFAAKLVAYGKYFPTLNLHALLIGLVALAVLILWPYVTDKVPGSLIAIIVTTLMVKFLPLQVNTIGSVYGELSSALPKFQLPHTDLAMIMELASPAFTIAILAAIESLLSCVVSDGMVGSRHRSNAELVGQGVGNIASALFGGLPATGAIARTAANAKNGGRTPIAGIVHAVTLLIILVVLMPLAALIPMPALAAVLIMVAYNMSGWRECITLVRNAPKSDIIVFALTLFLTVVFDLVVAIEVGMIVAAVLFMKRMADTTELHGWTYMDEVENRNDPDNIKLRAVPKGTLVYEIEGPMFFGAADKFMDISIGAGRHHIKAIVLRMRGVPAMDATALHTLRSVYGVCRKKNIILIFSHTQEQPLSMMQKAKFYDEVGAENYCENIDAALARAAAICQGKKV